MQKTAALLGWGVKRLFSKLRDANILTNDNRPNQPYIDAGYFVTELKSWDNSIVGEQLYSKTLVTTKGVKWLDKKINQHATEGAQA